MKFLPFVLKHLRRNWLRTTSTVLAVSVCIFLFCTLQTLVRAVNFGLENANASRLITRHYVSLVLNMPVAYEAQIRGIPGVKSVAIANWFGGRYGDRKDFFANFAIEPEAYLAMYPEFVIPEEQKAAFLADRRGAVVGRRTAEKFKWKVGDTFELESNIGVYKKASPFEFKLDAIYDTDEQKYPGTDLSQVFFHYDYLVEGLAPRHPLVGIFVSEIDHPDRAGEVAAAIDARYENSETQTHTETEKAFAASFVSLAGNLAFLLNAIGLAVMFTILLVTANTMSMAVRERRTEIAVLKTLGFPGRLVLALVLGEGVAIGCLGGLVGVGLGGGALRLLTKAPMIGRVLLDAPELGLSPRIAALGLAVSLLLGLLASFLPALGAYRARITDALRAV